MITAFVSAITMTIGANISWLSADDLVDLVPNGFKPNFKRLKYLDYTFRQIDGEKSIRIEGEAASSDSQVDAKWEAMTTFAQGNPATAGTKSGLPLGTFSTHEPTLKPISRVTARIGRIIVQVTIGYAPIKLHGKFVQATVDPTLDRILVERICRGVLARQIGMELNQSGNVATLGVSLPALQRSGKSKVLRMNTLAARGNFSPEYDAEMGLYRFQWRGKSVVVPLASDQIKVNGVWKKLGEFVLQKNKETYIDPVGLDAAVGN